MLGQNREHLIDRDIIQRRLFIFSAIFLFLFSVILTLSSAVRQHSWEVDYRWQHWIGFLIWITGFGFVIRSANKFLPDHDPYLIPIISILTGWGLLTIWRLDESFGLRQTFWLLLAFIIFIFGLRVRNALVILYRYKYLWLLGGITLTALTFILGIYPSGSGPRLWLGCCGFYIQPSEPLKLILVIFMAAYFSDRSPYKLGLIQLILPTFIMAGISIAVLIIQRDLGTAILFVFLYTIMVYFASNKKRILLISAGIVLVAIVIGFLTFPIIRDRITSWLSPWSDPEGQSYQLIQSILAVAAGGVFGTGPGLGSPSVIPVAISDFIFSAIAEEMGLLGVLNLLLLFGLFSAKGILIALRAPNLYQRYLAGGIIALITGQTILIIGGNIRMIPLTGVTVPFISYGGSSLLTSMLAFLFLCIISNQKERIEKSTISFQSFHVFSTGLYVAFTAIALITGWWGFLRREDLLNRPDNPRRAIADRFVERGRILDRNNIPIVESVGTPGNYFRRVRYIPLTLVTGYAHPMYGLTGIEESMQPYLRGLQGLPTSDIWLNHLLYSQPPPGLDVRLSIHLELQKKADDLLGNRQGSIIMVNAQTGEILLMVSHPYYDPNQLADKWSQYKKDLSSPFLNRAVQGQYFPGNAITPFLMSFVFENGVLPSLPTNLSIEINEIKQDCALSILTQLSWGSAVVNGCPGALKSLLSQISSSRLIEILNLLGFEKAPEIPLPTLESKEITLLNPQDYLFGLSNIYVSPLQMVLAAAALSTNGTRPAPRLALAVHTPNQGWVVLPSGKSTQSLPTASIFTTVGLLSDSQMPIWQTTALAYGNDKVISWYLAGTNTSWQGTPLAIVVALEENNPVLAKSIGNKILLSPINP
jgi:cell division protein FtsW (lipid II flippase)